MASITKSHDQAQPMIEFLQDELRAKSLTQLAGYIGVSERTLNDWRKGESGRSNTSKRQRLSRLVDVVQFIKKNSSSPVKDVLLVGRVRAYEGDEDDDGTLCLLDYVVACPDDKGWIHNVEAALKSYVAQVEARKAGKGNGDHAAQLR